MGTVVWKEMKSREIPRGEFAKMLKAQNIQISDLFKKEIIPPPRPAKNRAYTKH